MGRWLPGARGRLEEAAMQLFAERGYEGTTVADIAARADLTERTFFRHFADKREVLFSGSDALQALLVESLTAAAPDTPPLAAVEAAFVAVGDLIGQSREHSRSRQRLVTGTAELAERELAKMSTLARLTAETLRERGTPPATAALVGELGVTCFRLGFERWVSADDDRTLAATLADAFAELRAAAR